MRIDDLILLTLKYSDKNMIAGRTLLQKTLYFIQEKLNLDFEFTPHYYGPYSTQVTDNIADLCAAGILREDVEAFSPFSFGVTFEPRKYTYSLTEKGQEVAQLVEKRNAEAAENVKSILVVMKNIGAVDDYKSLSVAAKMYHILKNKKQMKSSEILVEAKALDWNIDKDEAEAAIDFLLKMEFAKIKKTK